MVIVCRITAREFTSFAPTRTHAPRRQLFCVRYFSYFSLACKCVNRKWLQLFPIAVHRSPCATCIHVLKSQAVLGKASRASARAALAVLWAERIFTICSERTEKCDRTHTSIETLKHLVLNILGFFLSTPARCYSQNGCEAMFVLTCWRGYHDSLYPALCLPFFALPVGCDAFVSTPGLQGGCAPSTRAKGQKVGQYG